MTENLIPTKTNEGFIQNYTTPQSEREPALVAPDVEAISSSIEGLVLGVLRDTEARNLPLSLSEGCLAMSSPHSEVRSYIDDVPSEESLIGQLYTFLESAPKGLELTRVHQILENLNNWVKDDPQLSERLNGFINEDLQGGSLQLPFMEYGYDKSTDQYIFRPGATIVAIHDKGVFGMYYLKELEDAVLSGTITLPPVEGEEIEWFLNANTGAIVDIPAKPSSNGRGNRNRKSKLSKVTGILAISLALAGAAAGVAVASGIVELPKASVGGFAGNPDDIDIAVAPNFEIATPTQVDQIPAVVFDPATATVVVAEAVQGPEVSPEEARAIYLEALEPKQDLGSIDENGFFVPNNNTEVEQSRGATLEAIAQALGADGLNIWDRMIVWHVNGTATYTDGRPYTGSKLGSRNLTALGSTTLYFNNEGQERFDLGLSMPFVINSDGSVIFFPTEQEARNAGGKIYLPSGFHDGNLWKYLDEMSEAYSKIFSASLEAGFPTILNESAYIRELRNGGLPSMQFSHADDVSIEVMPFRQGDLIIHTTSNPFGLAFTDELGNSDTAELVDWILSREGDLKSVFAWGNRDIDDPYPVLEGAHIYNGRAVYAALKTISIIEERPLEEVFEEALKYPFSLDGFLQKAEQYGAYSAPEWLDIREDR